MENEHLIALHELNRKVRGTFRTLQSAIEGGLHPTKPVRDALAAHAEAVEAAHSASLEKVSAPAAEVPATPPTPKP